MGGDLLHAGNQRVVHILAGGVGGDAQSVGMGLEDSGAGDIRQGTGIQVAVGFGIDKVQHLQLVQVKGGLAAQQLGKVVVVQAAVAHIHAAEGAADKLCVHGGRQLNGSQAIGDAVHAVGDADLGLQLADHPGHGRRGHEAHVPLIGQAELVGEHDAVHATILQGVQVARACSTTRSMQSP